MADKKPETKLPRRKKSPVTVREHAAKQTRKKAPKESKIKSKLHRPLSVLRSTAAKEYNPIPVPDNKAGRILGKRFTLIPKFFKNSWAELKLVTWPSRKEAAKLTSAVFVFAIIFAIFIQLIDMVFNKLFKIILLK
jgi:preprotein translocase SecE subunit